MNNKGMSLVELIITFALVMVIVVGLYNLILEVKFQIDEKQNAKDLTQFSSVMNNKIHYDLLKNQIEEIYIKSSEGEKCIGNNGNVETNCSSGMNTFKTSYADNSNCVIYSYKAKSTDTNYSYKIIILNPNDNKGIQYGDGDKDSLLFEAIPIEAKYINISTNFQPSIKYDNDTKFLVINYPIVLKGDTTKYNYGFKIAYPVES